MVQNGRLAADVEPRRKRRMRSKLERGQVVEETMQLGAPSVAVIARAHGVNANQVFNWRKLYHAGRLNDKAHATELLPVQISGASRPEYPLPERPAIAPVFSGSIHIEVGRARIRVEGSVNPENLRMVLEPTRPVISLPSNTSIWIAAGVTDMRRGFTGLSAAAQTVLEQNPYSGHVFVFRGRRGDLVKVLWWDGDGLCLFAKRLERGRFVWPQADQGVVSLSRAQLSMLLEGIDWRRPIRTAAPSMAV
jgi:transposase